MKKNIWIAILFATQYFKSNAEIPRNLSYKDFLSIFEQADVGYMK